MKRFHTRLRHPLSMSDVSMMLGCVPRRSTMDHIPRQDKKPHSTPKHTTPNSSRPSSSGSTNRTTTTTTTSNPQQQNQKSQKVFWTGSEKGPFPTPNPAAHQQPHPHHHPSTTTSTTEFRYGRFSDPALGAPSEPLYRPAAHHHHDEPTPSSSSSTASYSVPRDVIQQKSKTQAHHKSVESQLKNLKQEQNRRLRKEDTLSRYVRNFWNKLRTFARPIHEWDSGK